MDPGNEVWGIMPAGIEAAKGLPGAMEPMGPNGIMLAGMLAGGGRRAAGPEDEAGMPPHGWAVAGGTIPAGMEDAQTMPAGIDDAPNIPGCAIAGGSMPGVAEVNGGIVPAGIDDAPNIPGCAVAGGSMPGVAEENGGIVPAGGGRPAAAARGPAVGTKPPLGGGKPPPVEKGESAPPPREAADIEGAMPPVGGMVSKGDAMAALSGLQRPPFEGPCLQDCCTRRRSDRMKECEFSDRASQPKP